MLSKIHPDIIKAHKKAAELQKRVDENSKFSSEGFVSTDAPAGMRGAANRAERKLGKVIKRHHPNISLQEEVDLRNSLQEHELPHWKKD